MSIQLQIEEMPGYLAARFTGVGAAEEVWRQFELIAEHCERTKNKKLLIDTAKAEGEVSIIESFLVGERTELFMLRGIKIAWLETPERKGPVEFGELVARNRWVDARVFTNVADAKEWLLKQ